MAADFHGVENLLRCTNGFCLAAAPGRLAEKTSSLFQEGEEGNNNNNRKKKEQKYNPRGANGNATHVFATAELKWQASGTANQTWYH